MQRQVYIQVNGKYVGALYAVRNAGWAISYAERIDAQAFTIQELARAMKDVRSVVGTGAVVQVVAK